MKILAHTGKGGPIYRYDFSGTFITRDGALLVVPPPPGRSSISKADRDTENKMLKVLFSTNLNPRSGPSVTRECETRDGRRSAFSRLLKAAGKDPVESSKETRSGPAAVGRRLPVAPGSSQWRRAGS